MICRKCGELIGDNDKFCPACGAPQSREEQPETGAVLNPRHVHYEDCTSGSHSESQGSVGFMQAVALFFKNYTNFHGRSRRSEYWWAWLFNAIVSAILTTVIPDHTGFWTLVVCIPTLSLAIRRLHDIGRSGWWYLLNLIPVAGSIVLLIWFCKDSVPGENRWGYSPKY